MCPLYANLASSISLVVKLFIRGTMSLDHFGWPLISSTQQSANLLEDCAAKTIASNVRVLNAPPSPSPISRTASFSPKRVAPVGIYDSSYQKGVSNLAGSHTHHNISVLNLFG